MAEPYDGHALVNHPAKEASCESFGNKAYQACEKCNYSTYEEIPRLPHTPVVDGGYAATENDYGLTDGSHCFVCGEIIVKQQVILPTGFTQLDNYAGDYGYNYLGTLSGGANMQSLYRAIDEVCDAFHISSETIEEDTLATFTLSDYGTTLAEAAAVIKTYKNDNPLYYWISPTVSYNDISIAITVDEEYMSAETRLEYNKAIYDGVKSYLEKAAGYSTAYELALAIHDEIIRNVNYSYENDGITPSDAASAHNVLGVFVFGEGVCESYAKTFQLLLNYCDVENVLVSGLGLTGTKGEPHAWNLVRLDDGEYYWYDLTWDDTPGYMGGISYNYLATSDTAPLGWRDYGWIASESKSFTETHLTVATDVGTTVESGLSFVYGLPKRAESPIALTELRVSFTLDGIGYVRYNYDRVQVVSLPEGDVILPETVEYLGRRYLVTSVGAIDANGLFNRDPVSENTTSIHLSKNIDFICDRSLEIATLASITVDEDNPFFTSQDGILFTKNMTTLVKYPAARAGEEYTIPDSVLYVAFGGMYYLRSVSVINVGERLVAFGIAALGYAYPDSEDAPISYVFDGDLDNIRNTMAYLGRIVIDPDNPNFE